MASPKYDIIIDEGADYAISFTVKDDNDDPMDFTDFTGRMHLKNKIDGNITLDYSPYISIVGNLGLVNIIVPASATINAGFINGVYDVELESSSGNITKIVRGNVEFIREVTN